MIGSDVAIASLFACMKHDNRNVRCDALGGLAQGLEETDRCLLTRDLDGMQPFLDPRSSITEARAQRAASKLDLPLEEVKTRYETLAARFGLHLSWCDQK